MDVFLGVDPRSRHLERAADLFRALRGFSVVREEIQAKAYARVWLQEQAWALGTLVEPCLEGVLVRPDGAKVQIVLLDSSSQLAEPYAMTSPDAEWDLHEAMGALIRLLATPAEPAVRVNLAGAWACPTPKWAKES